MSTLEDVIAGRRLHRIEPAASTREAARLMTLRQVSALPVVDGEVLVGIVTERDLVQRVLAEGRWPDSTPVAEVMSSDLVIAGPSDAYEDALARMTRHHVRHLLVVADGRLQGVVSMRDLLFVDATEKAAEIELLNSYIYAVPAVLPPMEPPAEEWAHTLVR